jgi:hypothetical protein
MIQQIEKTVKGIKVIEYKYANIFVLENVFEEELCEEFRQIIETIPLKKIIYAPRNNVKCYTSRLDEMIEENFTDFYEFSTDVTQYNKLLNKINNTDFVSTNRLNGITKEQVKKYKRIIDKKIGLIGEVMSEINSMLVLQENTGYILRKIYGPTRIHIDGCITENEKSKITWIDKNGLNNQEVKIRNSTMILALNDDYEGGVVKFPSYDLEVIMKKGSAIIFPPYWTHPHEVSELLNDTYRYTITTWFCEKNI